MMYSSRSSITPVNRNFLHLGLLRLMQHLARTLQISLEVTGTHRHLPGLRRRAVSKSRKEEAGFLINIVCKMVLG
jgi:hypothetical protein